MSNDELIHKLEVSDPRFYSKRKKALILFTLRRLVSAMQYSAIFASLWPYLKMFGVQYWVYGIVASGYQLSGILLLPIIGRIYDKTLSIKAILLILHIFSIVGNLMYSLPFSFGVMVSGRLIVGLGSSGTSATFSEITNFTKTEDRARNFALVEMAGTIGLLLGPAMNYAFIHINFHVGEWKIDYRNAAGIVMAVIWLVLEILTLIMVCDVTKTFIIGSSASVNQDAILDESACQEGYEDNSCTSALTGETSSSICTEKRNTSAHSAFKDHCSMKIKEDKLKFIKSDNQVTEQSSSLSLAESLKEVLSVDILPIHFITFNFSWYYLSSEIVLPLVTQEDLGWHVVSTSVLCVVSAVIIFLFLLFLRYCLRNLSEIKSILFATIGQILMFTLLIVYQIEKKDHIPATIIYSGSIIFMSIVYSLETVATKSLLSKVIPMETQGLMQSVIAIRMKLASFLGPLIGTVLFKHMILVSSIGIALCCLGGIAILCSLKRLRIRREMYSSSKDKK